MSNSFDFEQFKAQAIEQLKAGVPLSGKDGVLTPLLENLLNSALEGEMDSHLEGGEREFGNRRNGHMSKQVQTSLGEVTINTPPVIATAKRELYAWQHENARKCDLESNEALLGIYCKLEIYIIRFALIIQLARWTCGECDKEAIDIESVRRAIELAEYFRTTAIRVQTSIGNEQLNEPTALSTTICRKGLPPRRVSLWQRVMGLRSTHSR